MVIYLSLLVSTVLETVVLMATCTANDVYSLDINKTYFSWHSTGGAHQLVDKLVVKKPYS